MVFERLTALFASGGSRPPKELQAALAPIKLMGEDVYDSLVGYVTTGSPAEALLSFRSGLAGPGSKTGLGTEDVAMLLGNPGASDWPSPWQVRDLEKDIQKATGVKFKASLNDQYRLSLAHGALTPEQWVRYGRILESASTVTVLTDDEVVPRWLSILWGTVERSDPDRNQSKGPGWDVGFIRSLLTADGRTEDEAHAAIVQLAFVSAPSSSSWQPLRRPVLRGLADFVKDHHDLAVAQFTRSGAEDKAATLTLLGTDADLAAQLDDLWDLAARGTAKGVREQAVAHLATLPPTERASRLAEAVRAAPAAQAETATDYLARIGDAPAIEALNALAAELTDARKSRLLESALARVQQAADGEEADLELPPVPTIESTRLGDDFIEESMRLSAAANERDKARLAELPATVQDWQRQAITGRIKVTDRLGEADFARIRDYLNDGGKRPKLLDEVIRLGLIPKKGLGLAHQVRLHQLSWQLRNEADLNVDLRSLLAVATETEAEVPGRRGTAEDYVSSLPFSWDFLNRIDIENVWPFFAEHPLRLEQSLGMNTTAPPQGFYVDSNADVATAIGILQAFPSLPRAYVARLHEIALGTGKTHRQLAQDALAARSNAVDIAAHGLTDSRMEVRAAAATWLGRIGSQEGTAPLRKALASEKRETVMASILGALNQLGEDLTEDLSPKVLAAQAAKGLKAKAPTAIEWLPVDSIPAVKWADGTPVDPDIIVWWLRLATKLKDPLGAGLLPIYVSLLDDDSQERLGEFVLRAWIAEDTATASEEEARAHAAALAPGRYAQYQGYAKRSPKNDYYQQLAAKTEAQHFEDLRREKLGEYLGSASASKGILALTVGAPGHVTYQATTSYFKTHTARRAQIEALVTAASGNDDPAAIQLVLQVARRFKQRTVQEKATELIEAIAERRGWTADELADRTIPTAGFDDDGLLHLDYGPREFIGRLGRSAKGLWQIELSAADGKPIKALPAIAKSDDEEVAKESRKQLTTSKKEIKQLVDLQTARLFEAMCIQRGWPADQWRELIAEHPILRQVITGLVWQAGEGEEPAGADALFRLTPEGELIGIDDDTFDLPDGATVRLAHSATVTAEAAEAWRAHLDDYEAQPIFDQFDTEVAQVAPDATVVNTRYGWLSDSFAIRGRATRRGYVRGQAEDGGWFSRYYRDYPSVGLRAVIEFTGSFVPEELIPAAVQTLYFESLKRGRTMPLSDVPPILLAESIKDYEFTGDAGTFDPDWESKSQY